VIVLIHQLPDRPAHLVQILGRRSALPVSPAQHGAELIPAMWSSHPLASIC
jgi:hypothetical protein